MLLEWINPIYLDISYQEQIQEDFEDSSEIQLKGFLKVTSKNSFPPTQYCSFFIQNGFRTLHHRNAIPKAGNSYSQMICR